MRSSLAFPSWLAPLALLATTAACGNDTADGYGDAGPGPIDFAADRDGDGLCDVTEAQLGSDPTVPDTDGDRVPDLFESMIGTAPDDPTAPDAAQLVYLGTAADDRAQLEVRFTVQGAGEGHAGAFQATGSPYRDVDASAFFASASALSAQPPDHVRDVQPAAERFGTVIGETRLSFELDFLAATDEPDHPDCARGYPARYALKADGQPVQQRQMLLLITLPDGRGAQDVRSGELPFCFPADCF